MVCGCSGSALSGRAISRSRQTCERAGASGFQCLGRPDDGILSVGPEATTALSPSCTLPLRSEAGAEAHATIQCMQKAKRSMSLSNRLPWEGDVSIGAISTGSLALDLALGIGGLRVPDAPFVHLHTHYKSMILDGARTARQPKRDPRTPPKRNAGLKHQPTHPKGVDLGEHCNGSVI
jgi:hypothetical protein